jgi:ribonuclease HI
VRVFGWRLATDTLPTRNNKFKRTLEPHDICTICGNGNEDGQHATILCTKAIALRSAMREHWKLPPDRALKMTGKDWLLLSLSNTDDLTRVRLLLLFWRAWHLRNDAIHQQGREPIAASVSFLLSYTERFQASSHVVEDRKGKAPMFVLPEASMIPEPGIHSNWTPPPAHWIKLNTDGSFIGAGMPGGAGAIIRDHGGNVILAACSPLPGCEDAEEAELKAALMGLKLVAGFSQKGVIIELDCATVMKALQSPGTNRSKLWASFQEADSILSLLDDFRLVLVKRESNKVADLLAKIGRSAGSCIWHDILPDPVWDLVNQDKTFVFQI